MSRYFGYFTRIVDMGTFVYRIQGEVRDGYQHRYTDHKTTEGKAGSSESAFLFSDRDSPRERVGIIL